MGNGDILKLQEEASLGRMFWSSFIIVIPGLNAGLSMGYAALAQPFFKNPNTTTLNSPMSENESSWFVSIFPLALTCGALISGFLSESFGRRRTLMLGNLFQLAGWLGVSFSVNLPHLLLSRFVSGLGSGMVTPAAYNLLSEIALVRFRGALACSNTLVINVGLMVAMFLGAVLDFSYFIPLSSIPNFLFLFLSYFSLPESPLWMVKRGREKECLDVLQMIRGQEYPGLQVELNELLFCAARKQERVTLSQKLKYMRSGPVLKPLAMAMSLMCFHSLSGIDNAVYYSLEIMERSKIIVLDKFLVAFILQLMFTLGYTAAPPMLCRMQRKCQFVLSCLAMFAGHVLLATSLYIKEVFPSQLGIFSELLTPLAFVSLGFTYSIGMGPVTFALLGELFPSKAKEVSSGISITTRYLASSLHLKNFPFLANTVGLPMLFLVYSLATLAAALFMVCVVPETKDLTLTQLSQLFSSPASKTLEKKQEVEKADTSEAINV